MLTVLAHYSRFIMIITLFFLFFIHYSRKRFQDGVHTSFAFISLCVTKQTGRLHGLS